MKRYHYRPAFNAREFGYAERKADEYWKGRFEAMPNKPRITCRHPGCQNVAVERGLCAKHLASVPKPVYQKDKKRHAMYGKRWQKVSRQYLSLHPWCAECIRQKKQPPEIATVVDHIKPHRGDFTLFWDQSNWQPLCKHHHDQKTARGE